MWDNNTPLQLLKSMPKVLEDEHLEKLQKLLEADKYKLQLLSDSDLCGNYAPFCDDCNKDIKYPCAVAYVHYLKTQGTDIEIAADLPAETSENSPEEVFEEAPVTEEKTVEVTEEKEEKAEDDKPEEESGKKRIRIAIARKKGIL